MADLLKSCKHSFSKKRFCGASTVHWPDAPGRQLLEGLARLEKGEALAVKGVAPRPAPPAPNATFLVLFAPVSLYTGNHLGVRVAVGCFVD